MAKAIIYGIIVWCLLLGCGGRVSGDSISTTVPGAVVDAGSVNNQVTIAPEKQGSTEVTLPSKASAIDEDISKLTEIYLSQLHVRERTGNNDGVEVEMYLKSTGLPKGNPWCAAFVHWSLVQAKIPNKVTAWSPTAENKANMVFKLRNFNKEPEPGDVATFYYTNLGRIGHTGFFHKKINETTYESVEGNTNGAGSREGNGVYKKFRAFNSTYSISRWTQN